MSWCFRSNFCVAFQQVVQIRTCVLMLWPFVFTPSLPSSAPHNAECRAVGSGSGAKSATAPWRSPTATLSSSTSRGSTRVGPLAAQAAITATPKPPTPQGRARTTKARGRGLRSPALRHLSKASCHAWCQQRQRQPIPKPWVPGARRKRSGTRSNPQNHQRNGRRNNPWNIPTRSPWLHRQSALHHLQQSRSPLAVGPAALARTLRY